MTNANFTGANVTGASFSLSNLTASQLYSTASYQAKNLQGINLGADMTGWNLSGQDLTDANLSGGTMTNANLTGATIVGANLGNNYYLTAAQLYSTASYKAGKLQGIGLENNDMTGWNLSGQDLTDANLGGCTLTNANLTGANLTNVFLQSATLSSATLTNANLTNANIYAATLSYATLTNATLTNANLSYGTLNNANLTGANLANANLSYDTLSNANVTGADLRGAAVILDPTAITTNAILPNGTVQGLNLNATNPTLVIRNYSGNQNTNFNIPIHIQQGMTMTQGSSLVLAFDGNAWGSTISFDPGIPVTLGGNLELDLAAGVNPASLVGDSYQVFDWTGVSPSGQFASITNDLPAGYSWDTSQLYATGNVTLTPEPSTLALFAAGAIGLAGYGSWRRRTTRTAKPTAFTQQDAPPILAFPSHPSLATRHEGQLDFATGGSLPLDRCL